MEFNKNNVKDIIDEWFECREESIAHLTPEDKKHLINFDKHADNIIKNVLPKNKKYVKSQLDSLFNKFMDYVSYWNEKYYMNGFCDGMQLIYGSFEK